MPLLWNSVLSIVKFYNNMKTRSQIIDLCKKLYALAKQWIGWEATNAQAQLDAVLKKYEISIHEIEQTEMLEERTIFVPAKWEVRTLIEHLISSLITEGVTWWAVSPDNRRIFVAMTKKNYMLFQHYLPIYTKWLRKHMAKQRKISLRAFMETHELFSKWTSTSDKKPTAEELEIIYAAMRQNVEHVNVNPALSSWTHQ